MRLTIARLRTGILVVAGLIVVVILGFFFYARYRLRHIDRDLPAKLGITIQQSTNGFTLSKSDKDHTLFTIHASKAVQYKSGGRAKLHDVSITLYGPVGSNRKDRIYGSDFEYDPPAQSVSSAGEVQIDLESPAQGGSKPTEKPGEENDGGTIHVKTVGLVFSQKTGIATTEKGVEFHFPKAAGSAVGATYDSHSGTLSLKSAVNLSSSVNSKPVLIHAAQAQMLRTTHQVFLVQPECVFQNMQNSADEAVVYFRRDGSAERLDARRNVRMHTDTGMNLRTQQAHIQLDEESQPRQADLAGGVYFESKEGDRALRGNSQEATATFAGDASLRHVQMRTAASLVDQLLKLPDDPHGSTTREIRSTKLDVDFLPGGDGQPQAQKALATGNAVAVLHTISSQGPQSGSTISADQLLATLSNGNAMRRLDGSGHTKIVDLVPNGAVNTSSGDTLVVTFLQASAKGKAHASPGMRRSSKAGTTAQVSQIDTALQTGHVHLEQTPAKDTKATPLHASAERAEFQASTQQLKLDGSPRVNNGSLDMSAEHIVYHRDSGDATAQGSVKATTSGAAQGGQGTAPSLGGQGPTHIVADQAKMQSATGNSIFNGHARLWQGSNSVTAPVIELSRSAQTLYAHGDGGAHEKGAIVKAVLLAANKKQQSVARISGQELNYSDGERKGIFKGSVLVEDANGRIHCDETTFYLSPVGTQKKGESSSEIDHIVATGKVKLEQPGRNAVGEKLMYTQSDSRYVLTGSAANPPKVFDRAHGTVTGASLIFNGQDDSVTVNGGQSGAVTNTRSPK